MAKPKFLVDTMLGRLGRWLRILGYDAIFVHARQRKRILERSFLERRVLLTREAKLANAHAYKLVIFKEQHWWDQLGALWKSLELQPISRKALFSRCTKCNVEIEKIPKTGLRGRRIPPKVLDFHKNFTTCPKCKKIFWEGSHLENTLNKLKEIHLPASSLFL